MVYRIYVEKKPEFSVEAKGVFADLSTALRPQGLSGVRILNRYDVEGISLDVFDAARDTVFSEPQVDRTWDTLPELAADERIFGVEYLPGQFDQRADSCAQCVQLMTQGERPRVRTARIYLLKGQVSDEDFSRIRSYLINPVESREASLKLPESLENPVDVPTKVKILKNFINATDEQVVEFGKEFGLAMDADDLLFCRNYFRDEEKRDPTITEIRMIDTYWSDHCRHTTFLTRLDHVEIEPENVRRTYRTYLKSREKVYGSRISEKPVTLMDLATMGAKRLKHDGKLPNLDESDEINACSVHVKADVGGKYEDWLLMFKNETHNHPTEIEPFGGAATCLGGAIRDPLSGRSYVYQAMRVTGSADPRTPIDRTMQGKLPQRKITLGAAQGYSSYGNQVGLATGQVSEIYHPGYVAKRMEVGAVVGAAPAKNVVREQPVPGDVVILLGGRTGRDGCGGATGSSRSHTLESLDTCGAEVQKGNPPEERKIQRLFRSPEVTAMIKRCNDFGAGGVSVAIGELADGLKINLNAVPKKYEGLDGTELAISESQERMAVVVSADHVNRFVALAKSENLEATPVAVVSRTPRLVMCWNGSEIVNLSRKFLNSNGAVRHADAKIPAHYAAPAQGPDAGEPVGQRWKELMGRLNVCSEKGLGNRFDSTIGAGTVLLPYGGTRQMTPAQAMAAKLPVPSGETSTCSLMAWGFDPYLTDRDPYRGAAMAVVESVARLVASGGSLDRCWLSFQEYFGHTGTDPLRWGAPAEALLGAFEAQLGLGVAAIGGKDSMSGTFEKIDVPHTLISFACGVSDMQQVTSPEFKASGDRIVLLRPRARKDGLPDFGSVARLFRRVEKLIAKKKIRAAWAISGGGAAEGLTKMAFGNRIGFHAASGIDPELWFEPLYGSFLVEVVPGSAVRGKTLGRTSPLPVIELPEATLTLQELEKTWEATLEPVFPTRTSDKPAAAHLYTYETRNKAHPRMHLSSPRVLIPVFPGTNCEYDAERQFRAAGAKCSVFVVRNLTPADTEESVRAFEKEIRSSQIVMIPGGFSGGDEPDGSGKFITAFFRNPRIRDAVSDLLQNRDGLMLGICNGFQALIKLGLVPYGEIRDMDANCPTLTFNTIGRHQSVMVRTRVSSVKSPWLLYTTPGEVFTLPVSHGEGRFVAPTDALAALAKNGQIACQYVDPDGKPSMDLAYNPNGSMDAVEAITSPDGRVLGKMAHSERVGRGVCKNIDGNKDQRLFTAGVDYFAI